MDHPTSTQSTHLYIQGTNVGFYTKHAHVGWWHHGVNMDILGPHRWIIHDGQWPSCCPCGTSFFARWTKINEQDCSKVFEYRWKFHQWAWYNLGTWAYARQELLTCLGKPSNIIINCFINVGSNANYIITYCILARIPLSCFMCRIN